MMRPAQSCFNPQGTDVVISALSPDQTQLANAVRRFAEDKLATGALARAHAREYPWEVAQQLSDMGMIGITIRA
jgi:alkylation response protein AidB-like acyl-CoA dehydrogenase